MSAPELDEADADEDAAETEYLPVRVVVRVRPLLAKEKLQESSSCVAIRRDMQVVLGGSRSFTFDRVFHERISQAEVFKEAVQPLVEGCFEGYNATVLAYGQTGSGKTFTMGTGLGLEEKADDEFGDAAGVAPRACRHLFGLIERRKGEAEFLVKVSYLEVYNEAIRDLLAPPARSSSSSPAAKLMIHEDISSRCITVSGIHEATVQSASELLSYLSLGAANRTVGSTDVNAQSSRSHAIFTIHMEQRRFSQRGEVNVLRGKLHLVDLAGSERNKRTKAAGQRMRESIRINQGLLSLGNVINALTSKAKKKSKKRFVPYRQSKLTRMLKDSLGGNSNTVFIACISPAREDYGESLNTLKYAQRAKEIENVPIVNDLNEMSELALMQAEVEALERSGSVVDHALISQIRASTVTDNAAKLAHYERTTQQLSLKLHNIKRRLNLLVESSQLSPDVASMITAISGEIDEDPATDAELQKLRKELARTEDALAAAKSDLARDESIFAEKMAQMRQFQTEVEAIHADREQLRLRVIHLESRNAALNAQIAAGPQLESAKSNADTDELAAAQAQLDEVQQANRRLKQQLQALQPRPKTTGTATAGEEATRLLRSAAEECVAQWFSAQRLHRELERHGQISAQRDACEMSLSELELKLLRARANKKDSLEQLTAQLSRLKVRPRLDLPNVEIHGMERAVARTKAEMKSLEEELESGDVLGEEERLQRQAVVERLEALRADEELQSKEVKRLRESLREFATLDEVVDAHLDEVIQVADESGLRAALKLIVQGKLDGLKVEREQQRLQMTKMDNEAYIADLRAKVKQREQQLQTELEAASRRFEEEKQALMRSARVEKRSSAVREMDEMYIHGLENELFHAKREALILKHRLRAFTSRSQKSVERVKIPKAMLKELPMPPGVPSKGRPNLGVDGYDETMRVSRKQGLSANQQTHEGRGETT